MMQTQEELVADLRQRFSAPDLQEFDLRVFESGIRQEDDWWYIPVSPMKEGVRPFDYAPKLSDIEESFEKQGVKMLLVPASGLA